MKRVILIAVTLSVLAGAVWAGAAYWLQRRPEPEWTSRSPRASKELELGLENMAKYYLPEARHHFEEALELDPALAVAKLHLAMLSPSNAERKRLIGELRNVDLDRLNARERFLVSYQAARIEDRPEDAKEILRVFRQRHPDDPYGFRMECLAHWSAQRWDPAEQCYADLLALHPNVVAAHNTLGYIAMARGRFDEAEEHFLTYRYLAPDQANPHHSLAELLTIRGRYEEATEALAEVVRIKPDFCAAFITRVEIGLYSGRFELASEAMSDFEGLEACAWLRERGAVCVARAWMLHLEGDPEGAWRLLDGGCLERREGYDLLAHRIAVMTGRRQRALEMEEKLAALRDEVEGSGRPVHARYLAAHLEHMEGIRALTEGDLDRAIERLSEADQTFGYWGGERASIKLLNRLNLLRALELAGRGAEAAALEREIDAVNPRLIDQFPLSDIDRLQQIGRPR